MVLRRKPKKSPKKCILCKGSLDGATGDVCRTCLGTASASAASKRVAEAVKNRVHGDVNGGFICPYCRAELSWETIKTSEIEVTIYVREKIYFCPGCRAFLGVSSWHTEG